MSFNLIHMFLFVLSEDGIETGTIYHSIRLHENRKSHVTQTQDRAVKVCMPQPPPCFQMQFQFLNLLAGERAQATLCHLICRQRLVLKYLNFLCENGRPRPTESENSRECANSSIKKLVNRLSSTKQV